MTINGKILERVSYAIREPSDATNIVGEKITVRPTFPFNPDSKTSPKTAEHWARQGTKSFEIIERDNEPFEVTIIDLVKRGNGGRAYKVVDQSQRMFDLREDQLMEVLSDYGILPGGKIPAQFIWAITQSQVHLTLVNGSLYKLLERETRKNNDIKIREKLGLVPNKSNMIVGHVYRNKIGKEFLFIGKAKVDGVLVCGFVEVPNPPVIHEKFSSEEKIDACEHLSDLDKAQFKKELQISKVWNDLTWHEKFNWVEYGRSYFLYERYKNHSINRGHYDSPTPITFLTNPKMVIDTGVEIHEMVNKFRDNVGSIHPYHDGNGADLSEKDYAARNGSSRFDYCDIGRFHHEYNRLNRASFELKRNAEILNYRKGWQSSSIVWIPDDKRVVI